MCLPISTGWWFGTLILFFHILGRIIPTDELIFFRRGSYTTNQSKMGDVANKIHDLRAMATRPAILNIGLQLGFCQLELIFIVEPSFKAGHQNSYLVCIQYFT